MKKERSKRLQEVFEEIPTELQPGEEAMDLVEEYMDVQEELSALLFDKLKERSPLAVFVALDFYTQYFRHRLLAQAESAEARYNTELMLQNHTDLVAEGVAAMFEGEPMKDVYSKALRDLKTKRDRRPDFTYM